MPAQPNGLQRSAIVIDLDGGLDLKSDEKVVDKEHFLIRDNVVVPGISGAYKRNGFTNLGPTGLTAGQALTTFQNELIAFGDRKLLSYNKADDTWQNKGPIRSPDASMANVYSDNYTQSYPDSATVNGITVYAYESTDGNVYAVVFDEATGQRLGVYVQGGTASGTKGKPKCVVIGNGILVIHQDNTSLLHCGIFQTLNPAQWGTSGFSIAGSTNTGVGLFDVVPYTSSYALLAWMNGTTMTVQYLDAQGVLRGFLDGAPVPYTFAIGTITSICAALNSSGTLGILAGNNAITNLVSFTLTAFTLIQVRAPSVVAQAAIPNNLTLVQSATGVDGFTFFFDTQATPTYNTVTYSGVFLSNAATPVAGTFLRSVGLASRAFLQDGQVYVGLVYASANISLSTYFFAGPSGRMIGRAFPFRATGLVAVNSLPHMTLVGTNKWSVALPIKNNFISAPRNIQYFTQGIGRMGMDFSTEKFRSTEINKNLLVAGSLVSCYDGVSVTEAGFPIIPEVPAVQAGGFQIKTLTFGKPGSVASTYEIIPPPDQLGQSPALKSGAQIRAGSYVLMFDGDDVGTASLPRYEVLWFAVDGAGSAPTVLLATAAGGFYGTSTPLAGLNRCDVSSTDDQQTVARKMVASINTYYASVLITGIRPALLVQDGVNWTAQVTTGVPPTFSITPSKDDTVFGYDVVNPGVASASAPSSAAHVRLTTPAGRWISSGQYFVLSTTHQLAGAINQHALFYYVVDTLAPSVVPTAPGTTAGLGPFPININSTDTSATVAFNTYTVINAARDANGTAMWFASGQPVIDVFSTASAFGATAWTTDQYLVTGTQSSQFNVGGGLLPLNPGTSSTRAYYLMYEWYDAQANLHRSAPSPPYICVNGDKSTVNASGVPLGNITPGFQSNIISATTLRFTNKTNVNVVLFRTGDGDTVPRRIATKPNDPTVDSISFTDTTPDAAISSAEILYAFGGGELPNICPPPGNQIIHWQGRVVLTDASDPNALWVSKPAVNAYGMGFSDLLKVTVDSTGGDITALGTLDEKLIIFKQSRVLYMTGEGPDASGQNGTFSVPALINTDVGCANPQSIVSVSDGLMFMSAKGIYLLDRNANASYIGIWVEGYNNLTITSATLSPQFNRVVFTTDTNLAIVYNYAFKIWATFSNYQAASAVNYQPDNALYVLPPGGRVRKEVNNKFTDAGGEPIVMTLQTSWLKPTDTSQGWARVYRALLLATYKSQHKVLMRVEYDYKVETGTPMGPFSGTLNLGSNLFGSASPFGSGTPFGDTTFGTLEQIRYGLPRQICQCLRFTIQDQPEGQPDESVRFVELQLEVGMRAPMAKVPASHTTG